MLSEQKKYQSQLQIKLDNSRLSHQVNLSQTSRHMVPRTKLTVSSVLESKVQKSQAQLKIEADKKVRRERADRMIKPSSEISLPSD